jgi:hypothetical protein
MYLHICICNIKPGSERCLKIKLPILSTCSLWYHKFPIPFLFNNNNQSDHLNFHDLTVIYLHELIHLLSMTILEKTSNGWSVFWILPVPIYKLLRLSIVYQDSVWKMFNILLKTAEYSVTFKSVCYKVFNLIMRARG